MSESVDDKFKGLDMQSLVAGPLSAAYEAELKLAASTAKFIQDVGLEGVPDENGKSDGTESVNMEVPLLSIVKIPTLAIEDIDIKFDMEVKSVESSESSKDKDGERDANEKIGFAPFNGKVKIKGSIGCHEKNTRCTDNSAKYHVSIHAKDFGTPEGLSRMLDVLATASTPLSITSDESKENITDDKGGSSEMENNPEQ